MERLEPRLPLAFMVFDAGDLQVRSSIPGEALTVGTAGGEVTLNGDKKVNVVQPDGSVKLEDSLAANLVTSMDVAAFAGGNINLGFVSQLNFPSLASVAATTSGNVTGSALDDTIVGLHDNTYQILNGGLGNDTILGGASGIVRGGPGNDMLGRSGSDRLSFGDAWDVVWEEGDDLDTLVTDGAELQVAASGNSTLTQPEFRHHSGGGVVFDGSIGGLLFTGGANDDTLDVLASGVPDPGLLGKGIVMNAGGGHDQLILRGSFSDPLFERIQSEGAGEVAALVGFTGLELLDDRLSVDERDIVLTEQADDVTVEVGAQTTTVSGEAFSPELRIATPAQRLRMRARDGDDVLTVNSTLDALSADFIVDAGGGHDLVDASTVRFDTEQIGGLGDDTLVGGEANDVLNGHEGKDFCEAGETLISCEAPPLEITGLDIALEETTLSERDLRTPIDFVLTNRSVKPFDDVEIIIRDSEGRPIPGIEDYFVDLDARESVALQDVWNIRQLLDDGGGLANLHVVVSARLFDDPNDERTVTASDFQRVDARPRLRSVLSSYRTGYYLLDIPLDNHLDVFVDDWNGNLPNTLVTPSLLPRVAYDINGQVSLIDAASSGRAARKTFDLGQLGAAVNQVDVFATTGQFDYRSARNRRTFTGVNAPSIAETRTATEVTPIPANKLYGKSVDYSLTFDPSFQLGLLATGNIPENALQMLAGEFGLMGIDLKLIAKFNSLGRGSLEGSLDLLETSFGTKTFFGPGPQAKGLLAVSADVGVKNYTLALDDMELTLRGEGSTPAFGIGFPVPSPLPVPIAIGRVSVVTGMGLDGTLPLVINDEGKFEADNGIIGIDGKLQATLSVGLPLIYELELTAGGKARLELVAGAPANERVRGFRYELLGRFAAHALGFEAEYPFQCRVTQVGTVSGPEDGCSSGPLRVKKKGRLGLPGSGESGDDNLPNVRYVAASPRWVSLPDDSDLLLWVDDDAGKADNQHLELMYSRRSNDTWSVPRPITNDTFLDERPSLMLTSTGQAVAVWARLNTTIPSDQSDAPHQQLGSLEIVSAVYDPSQDSWSEPELLTSNAHIDHQANLGGSSDSVWAAWLRDEDDDAPLFPHDTTPLGADLMVRRWNGSDWDAAETVVTGIPVQAPPAVAANSNQVLLAWSHDSDAATQTLDDTRLDVASRTNGVWSAPATIAGDNDDRADLQPSALIDASGTAHVAWISSSLQDDGSPDAIRAASSTDLDEFQVQTIVEADKIENLKLKQDAVGNVVLLFQARNGDQTDLHVAVRDAVSGDWSPPTALTDDTHVERAFDFVIDDQVLEVITLNQAVGEEAISTSGGNVPDGDVSMPTLSSPFFSEAELLLAPDLIVSVGNSIADAQPGETVEVTAVVRNVGLVTTEPVQLAFRESGQAIADDVRVPELPAGTEFETVVSWTLPETGPTALQITVDDDDEVDESNEDNNQVELAALQVDLEARSVEATADAEGIDITLVVGNSGAVAVDEFSVVLRQDDPANGTQLANLTVEETLEPDQQMTVVLRLPDAIGTLGEIADGWTVIQTDPRGESDVENNQLPIELNPYTSWTNPVHRSDVDGNGKVQIIDAFLEIDEVRNRLGDVLSLPPRPGRFWDPAANGKISLLDAFIVIDDVRSTFGSDSGEGETVEAPLTAPAVSDVIAGWLFREGVHLDRIWTNSFSTNSGIADIWRNAEFAGWSDRDALWNWIAEFGAFESHSPSSSPLITDLLTGDPVLFPMLSDSDVDELLELIAAN